MCKVNFVRVNDSEYARSIEQSDFIKLLHLNSHSFPQAFNQVSHLASHTLSYLKGLHLGTQSENLSSPWLEGSGCTGWPSMRRGQSTAQLILSKPPHW